MLPQLFLLTSLVSLSWASGGRVGQTSKRRPLTGQLLCFHSRGRNRSKWHWSSSPKHPSRHQLPSPRPPSSHPADEGLSQGTLSSPTATRIPEQGMEWWCPHILKGILLLHRNPWRSAHPKTGKQNGQVWCAWRFGWWSYTAHGPDHLPVRGHCQRAGWCSKPLYSLVHGSPIGTSQQGPPVPSHPHGRSLPKGPC